MRLAEKHVRTFTQEEWVPLPRNSSAEKQLEKLFDAFLGVDNRFWVKLPEGTKQVRRNLGKESVDVFETPEVKLIVWTDTFFVEQQKGGVK